MKNHKYILFLLVLVSCDEAQKKQDTQITEVKVAYEDSLTIEDFPTAWQRLTEVNGELTLYYPCKGGDRSIQFTTLFNGDKLMRLNHEGQYFDLLVDQLTKEENGYTLNAFNRKSHDSKTFKIEKHATKNNIFYWQWKGIEKEYRFAFTPFHTNNKFRVVRQPCRECPDVPCQDIEIIEGEYKPTLPYKLSMDGGDYREMSFTITKDSLSKLEIFYYPENVNQEGDSIHYFGKAKIDSTHFIIEFKNFSKELFESFNPKKETKIEYLNDSIFRFKKTVKGLIIDGSYCENWDMKKYKN